MITPEERARQKAERARVQAERERVEQEGQEENADSGRRVAESERVDAEAGRVDAEERRVVTIGSVQNLIKVVGFVVFVTFVTSIVLVIQVQKRNEKLNRLEDSTVHIEESTDAIQTFVDEIIIERANRPADGVTNEEIRQVFILVADIKNVVCSINPESESC